MFQELTGSSSCIFLNNGGRSSALDAVKTIQRRANRPSYFPRWDASFLFTDSHAHCIAKYF